MHDNISLEWFHISFWPLQVVLVFVFWIGFYFDKLFKFLFISKWDAHTIFSRCTQLYQHEQRNRIVKTSAKDWRGQTIIRFVYAHSLLSIYTHGKHGACCIKRFSGSSSELVDVLYCCSFFSLCVFLLLLLLSIFIPSTFILFRSFIRSVYVRGSALRTLCNRFLPVSEFMFRYPISHGSVCVCAETEKRRLYVYVPFFGV